MKTLTVRLPEVLDAQLNTHARQNGESKSEIVRRALVQYFSKGEKSQSGSFLDLSRDLAGSIEGPSDLSTKKVHIEGYGS